jgi:hypothetical protein
MYIMQCQQAFGATKGFFKERTSGFLARKQTSLIEQVSENKFHPLE